jgi:hypothetical protein
VPPAVNFEELRKDVRGREDLMAAVEKAHQIGKAVDTGRGHSGPPLDPSVLPYPYVS